MSETLIIDVSDAEARDIAMAAKAAGLTVEAYVARAAAERARDQIDAEAFFRDRAKGADLDALDRILNRAGGQPPAPGDERP